MVVPVFMDLRFSIQIKSKQNIENKIIQVDDEENSYVQQIMATYIRYLYASVFTSLNEPQHDKTNKMSVRPAKTQISMGIHPVWSESSLSTWRKLGSLATHWVHSEGPDQTGRMPRLIWVFAGHTLILLVLSCRSWDLFLGYPWLNLNRKVGWKSAACKRSPIYAPNCRGCMPVLLSGVLWTFTARENAKKVHSVWNRGFIYMCNL